MATNGSADPHHMSLPRSRPQTLDSSLWLKCYEPNPEAHVRLFCFPHGGGGPHIYKPWSNKMGRRVEVVSISLPGRGLRQGESAFRDIRALSKSIATELKPYLDRPFAMFGHSVGALLAYEVASVLQNRQQLDGCLQVFASAHAAPQFSNATQTGETVMHDLPDNELIKVIAELGLIPENLLKHKELMTMILDPIRADFSLSETYECKLPPTKLEVGLTAMGGLHDSILPVDSLEEWKICTTKSFVRKEFEGSHFYTQECQEEVLAYISGTIDEKISDFPLSTLHGANELYPKEKCLHELFSETAKRTPNSPAVVYKDGVMSYGQLEVTTDLLAKYLIAHGACVGKAVGIYMEHSTEYVIAYIAILKAGSAYVPIEVAYPEAMIAKTVKSVDPVAILTKESFASALNQAAQTYGGSILQMNPGWERDMEKYRDQTLSYADHTPKMPAYYVMTSGTTGEPKGIVCPHQGAVNSYYWRYSHHAYAEDEREAINVFFVWEVMRPLLQGVPVYVIPDDVIYDPTKLKKFLVDGKISRVLFTPSLLEQMLNSSAGYSEDFMPWLKIVYLNGEVVTTELAQRFKSRFPKVRLLNDYSISECHDVCTHNLSNISLDASEQYAPLGPPMSNVSVYILDDNLQPVPRGCKGEVYVGGDSVAIGYLNQPEKTAQRFLPDSVVGDGLMFRTGDGGRIKFNGDLEVMGRLQFMIKLRGFTIVPDAVATVIKEYPGVEGAVVVPDNNEITGQPERLVAYLVLSGTMGRGILPSLREYLKRNLPSYSVPSIFEVISKLPISEVTGKTDLKLLPKRTTVQNLPVVKAESSDSLELTIMKIWQEFLGDAVCDPEQDFFDLGGHSLMAIEVAEKLREKISVSISIAEIFENGTAQSLAKLIRGKLQSSTKVPRKLIADETEPRRDMPNNKNIAIIGASCRFPGVDNLDSFWDLLASGGCSIRDFTKKELKQNGVSADTYESNSYINAAAVLDNPFEFDHEFWGISKKEATIMDPQQRMFLQVAWEALESSGYAKVKSPIKTGVFAGSYLPSYLLNYLDPKSLSSSADPASFHLAEIGNDKDYLTTRASFLLNCTGPSLAVQTSCSTSLVAVATACQFLLSGQCDQAIAGASSMTFPQGGYQYQEGHVLSPDGKCRAFDKSANGTILGDGVGVLILKRLDDAIADGDNIRAVIKGFAINNDGKSKNGYSSPSTRGQTEVVLSAMKMAGVNPEHISYIEGHGTGTIIGDAIEFEALNKAFGSFTDKIQYCGLGSVKPNIGHSNIAAGMAGLCKLIMSFQHKKLPPTINFHAPNPNFNICTTPFRIQDSLQKWESPASEKRIAGISSFGIGGTNCHLILEEPPVRMEPADTKKINQREVLTFSAKSENSISGVLKKMKIFLKQQMIKDISFSLSNTAFTLHHGREDFHAYRTAITADCAREAIEKLDERIGQVQRKNIRTNSRSIVFMFPGQGSQYARMAQQLYNTVELYKQYFDECCALFKEKQDIDLHEILTAEKLSESTSVCQPVLFSVEYSLAMTLIQWGIVPSVVIGHSIGEYAAATIAGILTLESAISLVSTRAKAMEAAPAGRMLAVNCEKPVLDAFLSHKTDLWLAAENSHVNHVISGSEKSIRQAEAILRHRDFQAKKVHVNHAFHCPLMADAAKKLQTLADEITMTTPRIKMVSNVSGKFFSQTEPFDKTYWAQQMTSKVRFVDTVSTVADENPSIMLEVGPSRILKTLAQKIIPRVTADHKPTFLSTLPHPQEEIKSFDMLIDTVGSIWESGVNINWKEFDRQSGGKRIELPTYQFNNKICFPREIKKEAASVKQSQGKLDIADRFCAPGWTQEPRPRRKVLAKKKQWIIASEENERASSISNLISSITKQSSANPVTCSIDKISNIFGDLGKKEDLNIALVVGLSSESTKNEADSAIELLQRTLQVLTSVPGTTSGKIWIITEQIAQIDREPLNLANSAILSAGMVLSQENPNWKVRIVDIGCTGNPALELLLASELAADPSPSFSAVAFRGCNRWVRKFSKVKLPPEIKDTPAIEIQRHGVYIVTGGLGRIGLSLANFLIRRKCTVVVTTRSLEKAKRSESVVPKGIKLVQVDFGKPREVRKLLTGTISEFGKIDGIFHAAGCADLKYLEELDSATIESEFEPKVFGLSYLKQSIDSLNSADLPDFVVLFSSMASILGGYGMAAYASANSFMDAFCQKEYLRDKTHWISINWDDWDFEYSKEQTEGYAHSTERQLAMSPEEGIEALERILAVALDYPQILVVTSELKSRIKRWHSVGSSSPPAGGPTKPRTKNPKSCSAEQLEKDSSVQIKSIDNAEDTTPESEIGLVYKDVLGLDEVNPTDNFFDLGGDSLMAAQVLLQIQRNLRLPKTAHLRDIFQYPTPGSLAKYLSQS